MIIILYRIKPSIYQTQLTDFIGLKSIEKYDMSVPKDYRIARKKFRWIPIHSTWGKRAPSTTNILTNSQKKIHDFIDWEPKLKYRYLYRFPGVKIPRFEEFGMGVISKMEWDLMDSLKTYLNLTILAFFKTYKESLRIAACYLRIFLLKICSPMKCCGLTWALKITPELKEWADFLIIHPYLTSLTILTSFPKHEISVMCSRESLQKRCLNLNTRTPYKT